jgi:hypothetical protein
MENNEINVQETSEPKIGSRFGFGQERKVSSSVVKIGALGTIGVVVGLFFIRSPDIPPPEGSGVRTPEMAPTGSRTETVPVDPYSSAQENEQLKQKNRRKAGKVVVHLPGLQKIDRNPAGKIPPGSMVKAILVTGASNGAARVETKEALRIGGETLIPQGAVLLGQGQSTEERLNLQFRQVVFKDGSFANISAQGADSEDKTVGLKCNRIGREALKYGAAVGMYFVGGMAEGLQDRQANPYGGSTAEPTAKNALLNGTSRATLETANNMLSDIHNKAPIIECPAGKEIYVIFDGSQ